MFKKLMTLALAASMTVCFALATSASANTGPAEMVLKTAKAKKPAQFPHKKHQDMFKCEECHHTKGADGKQGPYVAGEEKPCESCHNSSIGNNKLDSFKEVGHANCKECHKANKDKGAPTKCSGCHVKGLK